MKASGLAVNSPLSASIRPCVERWLSASVYSVVALARAARYA